MVLDHEDVAAIAAAVAQQLDLQALAEALAPLIAEQLRGGGGLRDDSLVVDPVSLRLRAQRDAVEHSASLAEKRARRIAGGTGLNAKK